MFNLSTIISMNARVARKQKKDRERAQRKRDEAKHKKHVALQADAVNRYLQDNDQ